MGVYLPTVALLPTLPQHPKGVFCYAFFKSVNIINFLLSNLIFFKFKPFISIKLQIVIAKEEPLTIAHLLKQSSKLLDEKIEIKQGKLCAIDGISKYFYQGVTPPRCYPQWVIFCYPFL